MMQLPRGTFREIRRSVAIKDLLDELNREKYSGVASISSSSLNGTLVFKAGECILVKFQNSRGDTAWNDIHKAGIEEVDAALSLLGDAQIDLALEFNRACRIQRPGKHAPAPPAHRAAPSVPHGSPRSVPAQTPAAPQKPGARPASPSVPDARAPRPAPAATAHTTPPHPPRVPRTAVQVPPSPVPPPIPSPRFEDGKKPEADKPTEKNPDISSLESELDTFDTMDIDNVTDKIRTDCRTMIKQLHLDHLMER